MLSLRQTIRDFHGFVREGDRDFRDSIEARKVVREYVKRDRRVSGRVHVRVYPWTGDVCVAEVYKYFEGTRLYEFRVYRPNMNVALISMSRRIVWYRSDY